MSIVRESVGVSEDLLLDRIEPLTTPTLHSLGALKALEGDVVAGLTESGGVGCCGRGDTRTQAGASALDLVYAAADNPDQGQARQCHQPRQHHPQMARR